MKIELIAVAGAAILAIALGRGVDRPRAPGPAIAAHADRNPTGYATAQAATVTPQLEAYGQVQPVAPLPVNSPEAGVIRGLRILPGTHVRAGQVLAQLEGPEIDSSLRQSQADVRSTRAQLSAAEQNLAIDRQQLPAHLSTRAMVQQAESAVAQAQANFENAQSHLNALHEMATIFVPADGIALTVDASSGELVTAGQPIITLQPAARLWLQATYYGSDFSRIRPGMKGEFVPADGTTPIPVRVDAVSGVVTAGGGEAIGLIPTAPHVRWVNGEFGTVTLSLPPRSLVEVPTRSLILDGGKWWVLVHTSQGDQPQQVVPGPTQGWNTFLESGLSAGSQVVVEDAYLLFHRGIANTYQPPD